MTQRKPSPRPSVRDYRGSDLSPGWILHLATGSVTVLRVESTHGGWEVLVKPLASGKGKGTGQAPRVLWYWPHQSVTATHGEGATPQATTISRREASRAAAARRKAQREQV